MKRTIKLGHIFINKKINLNNQGFTLLEIVLVITMIGILTTSSFSFINLFIDYFSKENSNLLSTTEEKIGLLILNNDLIQAKNIVLNANELLFDSYYKGKENRITYRVYNSSTGMALGKITEQNISAVINNVKEIDFSIKKDLLLVDVLFVDSKNNTRNVKRIYNLRVK